MLNVGGRAALVCVPRGVQQGRWSPENPKRFFWRNVQKVRSCTSADRVVPKFQQFCRRTNSRDGERKWLVLDLTERGLLDREMARVTTKIDSPKWSVALLWLHRAPPNTQHLLTFIHSAQSRRCVLSTTALWLNSARS